MKNILVTGGAGYIGSHACKVLAQSGYFPIVYDNLKYGHEWAVQWGPFYRGELSDEDGLIRLMNQEKIEAILHFAAYAYVAESVAQPEIYYTNNVGGSLSLLKAAVKAQVKNIVFSSTCATYGAPLQVPIDETHQQKPMNPYGFTKWVVEQMLQDFEAAYQIKSISLRYFNAAGADHDLQIGEVHDPEPHLIPLALRAALRDSEFLTVFGTDYDTPDGTCIRDYIHVTDLATAHVLALQALEKNSYSSAYNLGNGQGFSVLDVVRSVEKVTGLKIPLKYGNRRAGDPSRLIASALKAKKELGWSPCYSDLDEIIGTAFRFFKKFKTNV